MKSSALSVWTSAGTLSRSKPRPVTGVVATTWNAGNARTGVGVGAAGAGRGAGADSVGARARLTGADEDAGAVTVTSGSVAATCPQTRPGNIVTPGNTNAPNAAASNNCRLAA